MKLVEKVDAIIMGGAMVYTFYRALDIPVGNSLVEEDRIALAGETLAKIEEKGVKLLLPVDHVVGSSFDADADTAVVGKDGIPDGWMALDIGPETRTLYAQAVSEARTIVWNGPMGAFELAPFAEGTVAVAQAVADNETCVSVIGGGDSVSAVNKAGLADRMTHISTGGGASLEFLQGKELPGIAALSDE